MKVIELKEIYDKFTESVSPDQATDFPFKEYVKIADYIPVAAKIDIAQKAAVEVYEEYDGMRSYNGITNNIIKLLTIISLYTDLEYDDDSTFDAYDILQQIGFFDYLFGNYIDVNRFADIYDDTLYQLVDEYNSLPFVLNRGLLKLEERLVTSLDNFIEKASVTPEEMDKLKESLLSINSTMDRVRDAKSAEIIEAYKDKGEN